MTGDMEAAGKGAEESDSHRAAEHELRDAPLGCEGREGPSQAQGVKELSQENVPHPRVCDCGSKPSCWEQSSAQRCIRQVCGPWGRCPCGPGPHPGLSMLPVLPGSLAGSRHEDAWFPVWPAGLNFQSIFLHLEQNVAFPPA